MVTVRVTHAPGKSREKAYEEEIKSEDVFFMSGGKWMGEIVRDKGTFVIGDFVRLYNNPSSGAMFGAIFNVGGVVQENDARTLERYFVKEA